jgi:hypothetical protein
VRREGKRIGGDDRNCVSLLTLFGPRTGPCPGISASNELIASAYPYELRVICGKLYMPAELQSIHKLVLDAGAAENVNDEMRAVAETLWPDLVHKLP